MEIIELSVDELTPYQFNAKKHPKKQIEQIKKSIEEFGFNDPVAVWGDKNIIVEGHGRVMAAKEMGIDRIPVIRLDNMTDDERKAYTLVHNKLTMNTDFDSDILELELQSFDDIDMTEFGFEIADDGSDNEEVEEVDDVETQADGVVKTGDIWKLGKHRLICGDSTDVKVIEELLDNKVVNMVYTDPPYGMNLDTDFSSMSSKVFKGKMGKKYDAGNVDAFTPDMIQTILSIPSKECFIWGADYFSELIPERNEGSWIVWDKRANGNDDIDEDYSSDKMYGSCFELCWSKARHKRDIARVKWAGMFGTEKEFDHKRHHPTQKPIALSAWFIKRYSKAGDVVLDLFGGSGSTLLACEQMDRTCLMCELDEHYCDVIIARWEKLTGEKAERVE